MSPLLNSFVRLPLALLGVVVFPAFAQAQSTPYTLQLETEGGLCSSSDASISCVRFNGDSAIYPTDTDFTVLADFDSQIGSLVPLTFPDFWLPDVELAFNEIVVIEATGEISGPSPTGTWDLSTGIVTIDLGPVFFPSIVQNGLTVDPFETVSVPLNGTLFCDQNVPPMTGLPIAGTVETPGDVTLVGRACVTGNLVNESFFTILTGTLVPEPKASVAAFAALLALFALATQSGRQTRRC